MLVKEELLRELILLLLRSLENRNPRAWSQLGPVPLATPLPAQLQWGANSTVARSPREQQGCHRG